MPRPGRVVLICVFMSYVLRQWSGIVLLFRHYLSRLWLSTVIWCILLPRSAPQGNFLIPDRLSIPSVLKLDLVRWIRLGVGSWRIHSDTNHHATSVESMPSPSSIWAFLGIKFGTIGWPAKIISPFLHPSERQGKIFRSVDQSTGRSLS